MNRIKKVFVVIHIILWVLLSLLVALQLGGEGNVHWLTKAVGFILTCLYVFYGHFFLLTRYSGKKKKAAYYIRLAGCMFTAPFISLFFQYKTLDAQHSFYEYYAMVFFTVVPIFLLLGWLARVTENLVLNTIRKEQLEKQAVAAELNNLKSQINPHFLFNTLNNIHTLVYRQAPAAPDAVLQLASLMRYMIYESNATTVPLSREVNYMQDYMALQQLRYKKAPVVDFQINGDIGSCHIAPLLFIHLLENSYKHSYARLEPGDIKVKMEIIDDTLTFSIRNPVHENRGNALNDPGGIGLHNVQKRLTLLYPEQHTMEVTRTDETFQILLKISGLQLQVHERKDDLLYH